MSTTTTTAPDALPVVTVTDPPPTPIATTLGAPLVSLYAFAAFGIVAFLSYKIPDHVIFNTLCGTAAALATLAGQYWLGSSNGSAEKSKTIAHQSTQLAAAPPPALPPGAVTTTVVPGTVTRTTTAGATGATGP
jgi:hypothetical protein